VVCDKKSYLYLNETTLDYVQQGLTGGFTFVNPSAKSSCGCGTSFSA
jgi:iron-sulfur cluster assembly protein